MILFLIFVPVFSFSSPCGGSFDQRVHRNQEIRDTVNRYKGSQQEIFGNFIGRLSSLEIMDNLSFFSPEYAQFFTIKQLRPNYSEIGADGVLNNDYLSKPVFGSSVRTNRIYHRSTQLVQSVAALPVEEVRKLKKNSASYRAYGPLPHLPPDYVPYIPPNVVKGLKRSIKYLSDKIQYMTETQIQALDLDQICAVAKELNDTGQNENLSPRQIFAVMRESPRIFALLKASSHSEALAEEILNKIDDRNFLVAAVPLDVISQIPPDKFDLPFLKSLKRRSYSHFLAISPHQIDGMGFHLWKYIVEERWKIFLRKPQARVRFQNLSVEKVNQMSEEDKEEILSQMNLSEKNFMRILSRN